MGHIIAVFSELRSVSQPRLCGLVSYRSKLC